MMPRLALFAATLIAVALPAAAQDDPQGIPMPGLGAEGLKPLPAPHHDLPPVPAPPGAVFPSAKPKQAEKPIPQDRDSLLAELYVHLGKSRDATEATPIAQAIEN